MTDGSLAMGRLPMFENILRQRWICSLLAVVLFSLANSGAAAAQDVARSEAVRMLLDRCIVPLMDGDEPRKNGLSRLRGPAERQHLLGQGGQAYRGFSDKNTFVLPLRDAECGLNMRGQSPEEMDRFLDELFATESSALLAGRRSDQDGLLTRYFGGLSRADTLVELRVTHFVGQNFTTYRVSERDLG